MNNSHWRWADASRTDYGHTNGRPTGDVHWFIAVGCLQRIANSLEKIEQHINPKARRAASDKKRREEQINATERELKAMFVSRFGAEYDRNVTLRRVCRGLIGQAYWKADEFVMPASLDGIPDTQLLRLRCVGKTTSAKWHELLQQNRPKGYDK